MRQLPLVVVLVSLSALLILLGGRRPGKARTYKAAPSTSYTDAAVGAVSSASEEISDAAYGAFEVLHSAVDAAAEVVSSPKAGEDPIALATAGFRAAALRPAAILAMILKKYALGALGVRSVTSRPGPGS